VVHVNRLKPETYILKDYKGNVIKGSFYKYELLKTSYPNEYLIEKIIKRNKNLCYVKYLGFDASHNQWIHSKNIENATRK
jgi:hypothetical protein